MVKLTGAAFLDSNLYFNRIENAEAVRAYEHFVAGIATSNPNLKVGVYLEKLRNKNVVCLKQF